MKVGSVAHTPQLTPYAETTRAASVSKVGVQGADKLELSESARQFQTLLKAAKEAPDVRIEKVEAIKMQIEAGTYKVDSRAVAEKLLTHFKP